jgi:hypothetical protein
VGGGRSRGRARKTVAAARESSGRSVGRRASPKRLRRTREHLDVDEALNGDVRASVPLDSTHIVKAVIER